MFFLRKLERSITLHPSYLGPRIHELLHDKLLNDVEGTISENYYIVCIMDQLEISEGRIRPGNGYIEYDVSYNAIVWRPFRGEVVDGFVNNVISSGCFVQVGPLTAFLSAHVRRTLAILTELQRLTWCI